MTPAPSGDPWGPLEAIATAVGTTILVAGAYFARRYGRRASVSVVGEVFPRSEGALGLSVRVSASSVGLVRLRFMKEEEHAPKIRVTEIHDHPGGFIDGDVQPSRLPPFDGVFVEPGETVAVTEVFHLPDPEPTLVGWRIEFVFDVKRPIKRWKCWTWADLVFVPLPSQER